MCLGLIVCLEEIWDSGGMPMGRGERADDDAVCLAYVPHLRIGDHVLVHLGFALAVLEPEAAAEAVAMREQLSGGASTTDP
ncbi:MAG: HypC/HybG/HupF family hydrogenase formation chaperone [bacterium]|nr:HypC/HybG/HupF family hydrogenase formation chaperone [bacterium]